MIHKAKQHARTALGMPVFRYLIMAVCIVIIELADFAVLNSVLNVPYQIATVVSVAVSIILNWYFSKRLVFKNSKYAAKQEFTLVLFASLIGLGIQLLVTTFCVELLNLHPFIGKVLAIVVGFSWNYWARKKYIFTS